MSKVWGWPWGSSETSLPRLVQNSYFSHASSYRENVASARRVVQNKPSALIHREENRVEFLARQFLSEKLSFVHKKESEHSFGLSLSTCVFYRRIFNLEMQNFSFVDG